MFLPQNLCPVHPQIRFQLSKLCELEHRWPEGLVQSTRNDVGQQLTQLFVFYTTIYLLFITGSDSMYTCSFFVEFIEFCTVKCCITI